MNMNKYSEVFPENELWCRLSESAGFPWTETLIDLYQDKIDWVCLSANRGVIWTARMLEKYEHKLAWRTLSKGSFRGLYSSENLKRYSSKWDWSELSSNSSVEWTMAKVEEFKDFIVWDRIINVGGWTKVDFYTLEFYEKYKAYIPASSLKNSALWNTIMCIYKEELAMEILTQ
jgi:hypothetical protein